MKGIALVVSRLFTPLIVPIYALLLCLFMPIKTGPVFTSSFLYYYSFTAKMVFLSLFVVFIVLGPIVSFLVLKKNKSIYSLRMEAVEERKSPLIIVVFYYFILAGFLYYQSYQIIVPPLLIGMAFGGGLAVLLAYFISTKCKICLHSMALGGLVGFFYMYLLSLSHFPLYLFLGLILLGGIVAAARIFLQKHTLFEVGTGYFIGIFALVIANYCVQFISY